MKNIILASQSPRRRELLTQIGLEFEVHPAGGEEIITSTDPVEVVKSLSAQKAGAVKEEMQAQLPENWLVIGADTIVVYDGKILGKPKDKADAIRMLCMLQGQTHSVYTGVTLLEEGKQTTFAEETKVTMYPMTEEEIRWYVDTKEPMDKAGAYGIQGLCARFVKEIPRELLSGAVRKEKEHKEPKAATYQQAKQIFRAKPYGMPQKPEKSFGTPGNPASLGYQEGDRVRHMKFGEGTVQNIVQGGRDYEVTVDFDKVGVKKMFFEWRRPIWQYFC